MSCFLAMTSHWAAWSSVCRFDFDSFRLVGIFRTCSRMQSSPPSMWIITAPSLSGLWKRLACAPYVASGRKEDLPDQVQYAVGADIGVSKRLSLALDFLGTYVIDSPRLVREVFTSANGEAFPQIGFSTESYNLANGSAGLKFNPGGRLLIDLNVLFKLDSAGLRDTVTPLVGIEYAF